MASIFGGKLKKIGNAFSGKDQVESAGVEEVKENSVLLTQNVITGLSSEGKWDAIKRAGELLMNSGYVEEGYIPAMAEREELITTYIGNHLAIPHGIGEAAGFIKETGIVVLQYPEGVDFGEGNVAYIVIGIAGKGDEHMTILGSIAGIFQDAEKAKEIATIEDAEEIYNLFTNVGVLK
ncbi:PTS sugar transporter subunit IIA [Clostridia bacterium]|nr:PTS sugar transporter subunit IIA [Clostridia bacterium]